MTISAKIILDSVCNQNRLTTVELHYPRFIHAELMTHRVFSRNASSSRAIPVARQIEMIMEDTAMPIHWGKNQPGMQAEEELSQLGQDCIKRLWLKARDEAISIAELMAEQGAHKQIVNRILEPFSHITVLVTSDQWSNFFALRKHKDAQPEIQELATKMMVCMERSVPQQLSSGQWHLPYIDEEDRKTAYELVQDRQILMTIPKQTDVNNMLCAISAARCARVSYLTHDKKRPTLEEDLALFKRLTRASPPHMSPCEHQAVHGDRNEGNFRNWSQFRHSIHGNTIYDC